ncbi:MAG: GntR family transcriptional regulator [Clostridia bacterium]|nr:GntR family transcriptional regulator [Clostridia bacterium]
MDIIISNRGDVPIYEQIEEQIKSMILSGQLKEGDSLPSMRLLAKELKISLITTKRAYEELEREGYIQSFTGKGCFVSKINENSVREKLLFEIQESIEPAVLKAKSASISKDELIEIINLLYD